MVKSYMFPDNTGRDDVMSGRDIERGNFTNIIAQLQTGAGQIKEFSPLKIAAQ